MKLKIRDSVDDFGKAKVVASDPRQGVRDRLVVFFFIPLDMNDGDNTFVGGSMEGLIGAQGQDRGRVGLKAFNEFEKVPAAKDVVGLSLPLTIVVVLTVIDELGELQSLSSIGLSFVRHSVSRGL